MKVHVKVIQIISVKEPQLNVIIDNTVQKFRAHQDGNKLENLVLIL
jgi:hypothetical protein